MKTQQTSISKLSAVLRKLATGIVSGLSKSKVLFRPVNKSLRHIGKRFLKSNTEKFYHKPIAKPVVEKQTLLKEKKKARTVH